MVSSTYRSQSLCIEDPVFSPAEPFAMHTSTQKTVRFREPDPPEYKRRSWDSTSSSFFHGFGPPNCFMHLYGLPSTYSDGEGQAWLSILKFCRCNELEDFQERQVYTLPTHHGVDDTLRWIFLTMHSYRHRLTKLARTWKRPSLTAEVKDILDDHYNLGWHACFLIRQERDKEHLHTRVSPKLEVARFFWGVPRPGFTVRSIQRKRHNALEMADLKLELRLEMLCRQFDLMTRLRNFFTLAASPLVTEPRLLTVDGQAQGRVLCRSITSANVRQARNGEYEFTLPWYILPKATMVPGYVVISRSTQPGSRPAFRTQWQPRPANHDITQIMIQVAVTDRVLVEDYFFWNYAFFDEYIFQCSTREIWRVFSAFVRQRQAPRRWPRQID